ncbi:MAG: EAL domain-containing protein, partial [Microbacteriaceae bacterium]
RIADTLNLAVVAEGVETTQIADKLRDLGIDYGQGYLFSRPIPEADFTDWWDEAIEELETSQR